jgi:predicted dinucleotide-binding enzyme
MHTPQTIAIVGAGVKAGLIARGLALTGNRVILCDEELQRAEKLALALQQETPSFNVEAMDCAYEATWESDILILTLPCTDQSAAAERVRLVANQKIVVTTEDTRCTLEQLLPYSRIIQFQLEAENLTADYVINGKDEEAVQSIAGLIESMGRKPVVQPVSA